jgi:SAM-dependent methyltransferase
MLRDGFFPSGDGITKGKGLSAILDSKDGHAKLLALFGGTDNLPGSVMRAKRPKVQDEMDGVVAAGRSYNQTCKLARKKGTTASRNDSTIDAALYLSGKGCGAGALSTFHQGIGRSMVLFYSEPGDTIFDPFAGHNSRMDLCVKAGRHYVGCDLSHEFMRFNRKRAKVLRREYPAVQIDLYECDSRKVPVPDEIGDYTITSPPYYDIEYYGDEPDQLGKAATYREFLGGIKQVLRENYRCLKPGAYAVWFVNDFRRKGTFHVYHADLMRLAEKVGFVVHDLLVVDFGRSIRDCFVNQAMRSKILPKRHEFGVVFRKPEQENAGTAARPDNGKRR